MCRHLYALVNRFRVPTNHLAGCFSVNDFANAMTPLESLKFIKQLLLLFEARLMV